MYVQCFKLLDIQIYQTNFLKINKRMKRESSLHPPEKRNSITFI